MHTPQLLSGALAVALATTAACSDGETRQDAREAAADARAAAGRAGERLADSWLTTKIQAQYFADEDIKARHIDVSTRDGVVVLTGHVDDAQAREQALQIARNTDGVVRVDDRLSVGPAPSGDARQADTRDPDRTGGSPTPGPGVDAGATSGAVPTTGAAPADGRPAFVPVDDASIQSGIQANYFLDNSVKARRIDVRVQDGVVTLTGEVASESERAQALLLARTAEGVQRVEDSLTVNAALFSGGSPAEPLPSPAPQHHDAPPEQ
jgi:osmotically-inducible protein OsmY